MSLIKRASYLLIIIKIIKMKNLEIYTLKNKIEDTLVSLPESELSNYQNEFEYLSKE